jgi:hypothetical protein
MFTNSTAVEASDSNVVFDSNVGYFKDLNSDRQAWMWKRHAGFTISTWKGDAVSGRQIAHDMNKTPEFMIVKSRGYADGWVVYHKGMNGGTNPQNYYMQLQLTTAEAAGTGAWNDTAPTSSHFTIGNWAELNRDGYDFLALLFASVDGISKVGYYTGNGNGMDSNPLTITTGFQPRFILIKLASSETHTKDWNVFDSVRGIGSGSDPRLALNSNGTGDSYDFVEATSTGFKVANWTDVGASGYKYIYYAHA